MASSDFTGKVRFPSCLGTGVVQSPFPFAVGTTRSSFAGRIASVQELSPAQQARNHIKPYTVLNNILLLTYLLLVGFILLVNPISRPRISNRLQWRKDKYLLKRDTEPSGFACQG